MKATLLLLVISTLSLFSCNRIPEETRVVSMAATDSLLVLDVPKARCYKCQNIIEGGLANELGVKQSILNLHTKQVSIVYSPEQTNPKDIEQKVQDLVLQLPCK